MDDDVLTTFPGYRDVMQPLYERSFRDKSFVHVPAHLKTNEHQQARTPELRQLRRPFFGILVITMTGPPSHTGGAFPKRCRCGRSFDQDEWNKLPFVGVDHEYKLEFRNCECGSTLAVPANGESDG